MDDPAPALSECAAEYQRRGWHPLELPYLHKGPPPEGRTGYEGVDMTAEEIGAAAWTGNIGLRMPADVIGLDVDGYRGGLDSLKELIRRFGPIPRTWISHNGRNDQSGIRFYRVTGGTWVTTLPGIDIIQHAHRYAAVWPSLHPDGRRYDWWDQTIIGPAESIPYVEDLPDLPWEWQEELARADPTTTSRAASTEQTEDFVARHETRADSPSYIAVIAGHFSERVAAGYSRHDTMQHCLTWAMECVRSGVAASKPTIEVFADLWEEALAGEPRRAELVSDHRITEFEAMVRHSIGKVEAKPQAEMDKFHDDIAGIDVVSSTGTISRAADLIDVYQPSAPTDHDGMLELVDWNNTTDPEDELVEGLVIPGRWTQFVAQAKDGKSSLQMFTAIELSEGRHPFDSTPTDPVVVLYCDGEMGERDVRELIEACGHDPAKLPNFHCSTERARLDTAVGAARLLGRVDALDAKLVVLDGLNGFVNPDATDNDDNTWKPMNERTIIPLKQRGVAVVSGDNMGKNVAKGSRGSSVKNDKADAVIPVKRTDTGIKLTPSHRRGGAFTDELVLEAHGFDRTRPIRYWRTTTNWPPGTAEAVKALDGLKVPLDDSRAKVRKTLKAAITDAESKGADTEPFRIANDTLGAALRWRRQNPVIVRTTLRTASPTISPTPPADQSPDRADQDAKNST